MAEQENINHITNWYSKDTGTVLDQFKVSAETGLSSEEADQRLLLYGPNEIIKGRKKSIFSILLEQFKDFMILVLLGAALVSGILGEIVDSIAIIVIVLLNAVIGFSQEYRADKAIDALRKMAAGTARVLRNKSIITAPLTSLVPGDIVYLETGNIVPADMRIITQTLLTVDEAALTGESVPQDKYSKPVTEENIQLGEQKNMLFKGTKIVRGRAQAVVVATGMSTELGKIAGLIRSDTEPKTPLQQRITAFGKKLTIIILALCVILFLLGIWQSKPVVLMFMTAVSLAVAAIPEALPAVITIALALGARKMSKKNALIRSLPAVETLGSVTFICSDKTGTLTQNNMKVEKIFLNGQVYDVKDFKRDNFSGTAKDSFDLLAMGQIFNNDAIITPQGKSDGEPTEAALLEVAHSYDPGYFNEVIRIKRLDEIPFDSERKRMSTVHEGINKPESRYIMISKGAPEVLLSRITLEHRNMSTIKPDIAELHKRANDLASNGYRVMMYAYKYIDRLPATLNETHESDMVFLSFVALMDPPRETAREAVHTCISAGITPVMITGDHPETAKNIANRLGISSPDDRVITGSELETISKIDFLNIVKDVRVYARVSPFQKIRIVQSLQARGQYVAMTGDGVNDAPALTLAEIGIAMGKSGTDVARESSDMSLMDDNFATIVTAVEEGRRVYDNIRKFIRYILTGNFAEILTITIAPLLGMPVPLIPIQILWVNLITDSLPALALANEKGEEDAMKVPPRPPKESIFARGLGYYVIIVGIFIAALSLFTQKLFIHKEHWQTIVFTVLSFSQLTQTFSIRSERRSILKTGFISNPLLLISFLAMILLQLLIIYTPALNPVFNTSPLSAPELVFCMAVPWSVFVLAELIKYITRNPSKR